MFRGGAWLQISCVMVMGVLTCSSGTAAEYRIVKAFPIAVEPACAPAMTRNAAGQILIAFGTQWESFPPGGVVKLISSSDNGQHWSEPRVIAQDVDPAVSLNTNNGLQALSDGQILLPIQFHRVPRRPGAARDEQEPAKLYAHDSPEVVNEIRILRSTDHGESWTMEHPEIPANTIRFGRLVEMRDGRLLMPVYGATKGRWCSGYHESRDFGKTWGPKIDTAPKAPSGFDELSVIQTAGGGLLAIMRQDEKDGNMGRPRRTFGTAWAPDGRHWNNWGWTDVRGKMPDLLLLPSGRLLMAVGAEGLSDGSEVFTRKGRDSFVTLFLSDDEGKTWQRDIEMARADRGSQIIPADSPVICPLEDGKILVVMQAIDRSKSTDPLVGFSAGMSLIGNIIEPVAR